MTKEQFDSQVWNKNTQIKYKGKWYDITGIDWFVGYVYYIDREATQNSIHYPNIDDIRQKPEDNLIVDIDKNEKVTIWNSYAESENFQEHLKYRFKAVECSEKHLRYSLVNKHIWFACNYDSLNEFVIYYGRYWTDDNIKYQQKAIDNEKERYYLLELLYEAPKPIKEKHCSDCESYNIDKSTKPCLTCSEGSNFYPKPDIEAEAIQAQPEEKYTISEINELLKESTINRIVKINGKITMQAISGGYSVEVEEYYNQEPEPEKPELKEIEKLEVISRDTNEIEADQKKINEIFLNSTDKERTELLLANIQIAEKYIMLNKHKINELITEHKKVVKILEAGK